jgi:opacity protein-like surface antigen
MKKGQIIVCASILCVFLMFGTGMAQETAKKFTLKLSGGYGSVSGGDLTTIADGLNELLVDIARVAGATTSGEIESAKWGPEFEGEFVYNITDRFGVGLGVGYIRKSIEKKAELQVGTLARVSFEWKPVYKVVPITLSGYYTLPVASKMNAFFKAGIGYYFATWDYKIREENELFGITVWSENEGTAKDNGFGFHGGLGIEYSISGSVALFVEGTGRYVNLKDWDVDNLYQDAFGSERDTGTFWYLEEFEEATGKYYPSLELGDEEPSGPGIKNARKAEISLSGVVFKLGVKFRF